MSNEQGQAELAPRKMMTANDVLDNWDPMVSQLQDALISQGENERAKHLNETVRVAGELADSGELSVKDARLSMYHIMKVNMEAAGIKTLDSEANQPVVESSEETTQELPASVSAIVEGSTDNKPAKKEGFWNRPAGMRIKAVGKGVLACLAIGSAPALALATAEADSTKDTRSSGIELTQNNQQNQNNVQNTASNKNKKDSPFDIDGRNTATGVIDNVDVDSKVERRKFVNTNSGKKFTIELNNRDNMQNRVSAVNKRDDDAEKGEKSQISIDDMVVGITAAMFSDNKEGNRYLSGGINFMSNHDRAIDADTGMSGQEEEEYMREFIATANCKIDPDYTGWVQNGYMKDGGEINSELEYFKNERVLICRNDDKTLMFKVSVVDGALCLNLVKPDKAPPARRISYNTSMRLGKGGDFTMTSTRIQRGGGSTTSTTTSTETSTGTGGDIPPVVVPPPEEEGGKNADDSPVVSDPNYPDEDRRPNVPAPEEAYQPEGAGPDTYVPPATVEVPAGVNPEAAESTELEGDTQPEGAIVTGP